MEGQKTIITLVWQSSSISNWMLFFAPQVGMRKRPRNAPGRWKQRSSRSHRGNKTLETQAASVWDPVHNTELTVFSIRVAALIGTNRVEDGPRRPVTVMVQGVLEVVVAHRIQVAW